MNIKFIYSDRKHQKWPSYHIIYEWEDIISHILKVPIINSVNQNSIFFRLINKFSKKIIKCDSTKVFEKILIKNNKFLYYEMSPKNYLSFSNNINAIPIIIDFWKNYEITKFINFYQKCPVILISSLELLKYLKKSSFSLNMIHFPFSLPDKYKLESDQKFEKKYDIVLPGRNNPVLWEYLKAYEKKNPKIEYIYQVNKNGKLLYINNKNDIIGSFNDRINYIKLIQSAKVTFYATPGIDGGEIRTGGFNPVTPRIFEMFSAGCYVIARYPKNYDTEYYRLESICPPVESFNDFKQRLEMALYQNCTPIHEYSNYLKEHYTSNRVDIIKSIT